MNKTEFDEAQHEYDYAEERDFWEALNRLNEQLAEKTYEEEEYNGD